MIYVPFLNYAEGILEPAHAMMNHTDAVPGLSDGGAHVGMICDGRFPTTMLTHWTRDRTRGPEAAAGRTWSACRRAIRRARWASTTAGVLAPGYRADLNVID